VKKLKVILSALALTTVLGSGTIVAADTEQILEARQAFMQVFSFNLSLVGDMAKGKSEYDAEIAANAAQNLLALSKMNNDPMWPQGTSKDDPGLAEKTRALPKIWASYPEFSEKHADLTEAMEQFVNVAGKDLASLRGGMKAVGEGCKGCHENFRAKKEEQ